MIAEGRQMSTTEASALDNFIVRMTKLWFGFEATLERWKMSMREHRIDTDFNPDDETIRKITKIIVSGGGHLGGKMPDRRNAVIDSLLIAGIIALVSTSLYLLKTTVKLETSYTERGQLYDERFGKIRDDNDRQENELARHSQRIDRLEQQSRRVGHSNPDDQ